MRFSLCLFPATVLLVSAGGSAVAALAKETWRIEMMSPEREPCGSPRLGSVFAPQVGYRSVVPLATLL